MELGRQSTRGRRTSSPLVADLNPHGRRPGSEAIISFAGPENNRAGQRRESRVADVRQVLAVADDRGVHPAVRLGREEIARPGGGATRRRPLTPVYARRGPGMIIGTRLR